jgi:hypothetical protein
LSDDWLRKIGARLMGKKGGQVKKRANSGAPAANARWHKKTLDQSTT